MNLAIGDRVEPGGSLSEVGELDDVDLPALVVFWRRANESISRHRCALLNEPELGMTPTRSITIDTLHCLYLGVMNAYVKTAMWAIFLSGVYGAIGTESENLQVAVMVMRNQLTSWYKHRHELDPREKLIKLSKLSTKSVGTRNNRCFKGKAAETWGVLLFFIDELRRLGERVQDGQRLLRAGQCLERIVLLWRNCDWEIPRDAQEERYTFRD